MISRPTSVEPVKAILSAPGCEARMRPVVPSPVRMFTTPGGTPASSHSSAKRSAVSGVASAGLRTTVFPAASAGAIFQASMRSGKFHGTICAHTPTGRAPGNSVSSTAAQPAWCRKWRAASGISRSRDSRMGLPLFSDSIVAKRRAWRWIARESA